MADEKHEKAIRRAAMAVCASRCAAVGDPPCWKIAEDWTPRCDGGQCDDLARAAIAAFLRAVEPSERMLGELFGLSDFTICNKPEDKGEFAKACLDETRTFSRAMCRALAEEIT